MAPSFPECDPPPLCGAQAKIGRMQQAELVGTMDREKQVGFGLVTYYSEAFAALRLVSSTLAMFALRNPLVPAHCV